MNTSNTKKFTFVASTALISGLSSIGAQADTAFDFETNPFNITELSSGYMLTAESDKMKDAVCGEGKCGSDMMQGLEEKMVDGNCAGNKPIPKMKKSNKKMEGKCGEGKCSSEMKKK